MSIDRTTSTPHDLPNADMVWIPGGMFHMGSENFYPEERPIHEVTVDGFWRHSISLASADARTLSFKAIQSKTESVDGG